MPAIVLAISPFGASSNIALLRASKPPVELVVADLERFPSMNLWAKGSVLVTATSAIYNLIQLTIVGFMVLWNMS